MIDIRLGIPESPRKHPKHVHAGVLNYYEECWIDATPTYQTFYNRVRSQGARYIGGTR